MDCLRYIKEFIFTQLQQEELVKEWYHTFASIHQDEDYTIVQRLRLYANLFMNMVVATAEELPPLKELSNEALLEIEDRTKADSVYIRESGILEYYQQRVADILRTCFHKRGVIEIREDVMNNLFLKNNHISMLNLVNKLLMHRHSPYLGCIDYEDLKRCCEDLLAFVNWIEEIVTPPPGQQ